MDITPSSHLPHQNSQVDALTIRPLKGVGDCANFQKVTQLIWGGDSADSIPMHVLVTIAKNGGLLMGAFAQDGPDDTGKMIGATMGWLGVGIDPANPDAAPRLKFCSHMAGVLPTWQGKHVGLRLKLAQREQVLAQGMTDWMTWTYDPLYRANGVFNTHRLGATCTTYVRNLYGEMTDDLNRGVPSDRCQVDWRLNSAHVLHKIEQGLESQSGIHAGAHAAPHTHITWEAENLEILPSHTNDAGFAAPGAPRFVGEGRPLAVPIPSDIAAIRRRDNVLSLTWRTYLRTVFEDAFAAGYTMVDCIHLPNHGWHYVLVREYV